MRRRDIAQTQNKNKNKIALQYESSHDITKQQLLGAVLHTKRITMCLC
jgi:hypothetical protein